jgi:hypothetical protein
MNVDEQRMTASSVKTPESESEVRVGDLGSTIHRSAHRHMGDRTIQWYKQAHRERAYSVQFGRDRVTCTGDHG